MRTPFLKDVSVISVAQVISGLCAFAYMIVVARFLGVHDYGLFQSVMALYATLSFLSLPLHLASVHCVGVSGEGQRKTFGGEFVKIAAVGGSAMTLLLLLVSPWLAEMLNAPNAYALMVMAFLLTCRPILTTLYGVLQGQNQHGQFSMARITESVVCLGVGTLVVLRGGSVCGAVTGYVVGMVAVISFFLLRGKLVTFQKGFKRVRTELESVSKILLSFGVLLLIDNAPIVIGRVFLSSESSGYFGCLYSLRNVILPFAFAISVPFYTRTLTQNAEEKLIGKALGLSLLLGGAFITLGLFGSSQVITMLYGSAFAPAGKYMVYYGLSLTLEMVAMIFIFDQAAKRQMSVGAVLVPAAILIFLLFIQHTSISLLINAQIFAWIGYMISLTVQEHSSQKSK